MSDTVLRWTADAKRAEQATGVPYWLLLGLIDVESGGREGLTSDAGAGGLTQFIPDTAASYGVDVRPGHASSQIMGAAKYLINLGYKADARHALSSYNAGPAASPTARAQGDQYADTVLARARTYRGTGQGVPASSAIGGTAQAGGLAGTAATGDGGHGLLGVLLTIALVGGGLAIAALGAARMVGVRNPIALATTVRGGGAKATA